MVRESVKMKRLPIIEIQLSMISLFWAFILFQSQGYFEKAPNVYRVFDKIGPEWLWGIFFLTGALLKITGIAVRNLKLRKIGLFFSVGLYSCVSAGYILGGGFLSLGFFLHITFIFVAIFALKEVEMTDA